MMIPIQILYCIVLIFFLTILGTPFYHFESKNISIEESPTIKLHGNFLHITDFHPDPHYVPNVTARSRCHGTIQEISRPKYMKKGISGPWGAPATICDSPLSLIDATFEWLEKNWKNKIDFVIWTGDNVRHDNDDNIPRTPEEIFKMNRMIAEKFLKTFSDETNFRKKRGPHFIPIVPSIGNNDVHPDNIISSGPNEILTVLYNIWSPFIPKGQHKSFLNGGYFYTEVIPNKLMVVSLNTLYFYKANTAVNGCKVGSQPGTIEMRWLNDVLKRARKRGMKVYLTGHVAPRAKQYTKSCYNKYGRLALKYHDIILGHYYGHSNVDHFFFVSSKSLKRRSPRRFIVDDEDTYDDDDENEYYDDEEEEEEEGGDDNDEILKIGCQKEQLSFEVPQESHQQQQEVSDYNDGDDDSEEEDDDDDDDDDEESGEVETNVYNTNKYARKLLKHYNKALPRSRGLQEKEYAVVNVNPSIIPVYFPALRIFKYNTTVVTKGDTIDVIDDEVDSTKKRKKRKKHRPSSTNTFLTPLGYTQYFINLTHANLYPNITPEFTIEYTTWDDYHMKDLTISSWIQLTQKIVSRGIKSPLWKKIREHLTVGTRSLIKQKKKKHYKPTENRENDSKDYTVSEF